LTTGVHSLIRDGQAKLITCLEDVLDELGDVGEIMGRMSAGSENTDVGASDSDSSPVPKLSAEERTVWDAISDGLEDPEVIASAVGFDMARVTTTLTSLQLKTLVRQLPGPRFVRRTP
jgi:predicted Rossmann fold nucleotide-binding protein DprA/Smf involved in DNA uptake